MTIIVYILVKTLAVKYSVILHDLITLALESYFCSSGSEYRTLS